MVALNVVSKTSPLPHKPELDLLKKVLTGYVFPESSDEPVKRRKPKTLKDRAFNLMFDYFTKRGVKLLRRKKFDATARMNGKDWPILAYTMVGLKRLDNMQMAIETVLSEGIEGDICECGVWRGGAVMLARATLNAHGSDRIIWAADSFEGLPKPDAVKYPSDKGYDLSEDEYLSVPLEAVKANMERFGLLDERTKFLKGWFSQTLPVAPIKKLAVLRADGDMFESTMDVLKNLYHKITPGGFMIVDDYGDWEPCRAAVDQFRSECGITSPIIKIDHNGVYWRV